MPHLFPEELSIDLKLPEPYNEADKNIKQLDRVQMDKLHGLSSITVGGYMQIC